jgi:hypothetical protein
MARKKIICLANSRKLQKHCVAGKDSDGNWIRLVNPGGSELALEDIINERGEQPKLLEYNAPACQDTILELLR